MPIKASTLFQRIISRNAILFVCLLWIMVFLVSCSPISNDTEARRGGSSANCSDALTSVIDRYHDGATDDQIDHDINVLYEYCGEEFSTAVDYLSLHPASESFVVKSCVEWDEQNISHGAINLLFEQGLCLAGEATQNSSDSEAEVHIEAWPEGGIGWNETHKYVGSYQRVCGPLASTAGTEWGTFVNLGYDYPSQDRFTFIIWDEWLYDDIYGSPVICATGQIYNYEGVMQAELSSVVELEIWDVH